MIDDALTFSRRYEISLVHDGFVSFVPSELCNVSSFCERSAGAGSVCGADRKWSVNMEHLYADCSLMQCLEEADGEWEDAAGAEPPFSGRRLRASEELGVLGEETFVLLISGSSGGRLVSGLRWFISL